MWGLKQIMQTHNYTISTPDIWFTFRSTAYYSAVCLHRPNYEEFLCFGVSMFVIILPWTVSSNWLYTFRFFKTKGTLCCVEPYLGNVCLTLLVLGIDPGGASQVWFCTHARPSLFKTTPKRVLHFTKKWPLNKF